MDKQVNYFKHNITARICLVFLLIVIIYLLAQAVMSGISYLKQYQLNQTLDQWYENKAPVSLAEWEKLEFTVISFIEGKEEQAAILLIAGRLYDYRSIKIAKERKDKLFYGKKSIDYYKKVSRMRPAWPYGWMNLALGKARLGLLDDEFKLALLQLINTGPWEKLTLPVIYQLSLFSWHNLDAHSHELLLDYFLIAQEKRDEEVYAVLQSSGKLRLYCTLVAQRDSKARFCP